jgi:hypothetical protein
MNSSIFGVLDGHATSHKLSSDLVRFVDENIDLREGFHLDVIKLPTAGAFDLVNGLYGPTQGDKVVSRNEVAMKVRKFWKEGVLTDRDGETPMVNLPERPATYVVVIWAQGIGDWCVEPTLITMYGHGSDKASPMEPWDENLKTDEGKAEAESFWAEHAISMEQLIID